MNTILRRHWIAAALSLGILSCATQTHANSWWGNYGLGSGERIVGSGTVTKAARNVSGFSQVQASGAVKLVLKQGKTEGITLEGDDNLLEHIETVVADKTLMVRPKKGVNLQPKSTLIVTLDFININTVSIGGAYAVEGRDMKLAKLSLNAGGSGKVSLDDSQIDQLQLNIGGSGGVTIEKLVSNNAEINIGGSGDVRASGTAKSQSIAIGGSGSIRADELLGEQVNVSIGGSGSARVHAKDTLNVSIGGSGTVRYAGDPKAVNQSVRGSGSVKKLEK
jgi:Putative auto-transporter adhesin, head GIN domain